ncbi:mechanosensitive ion channel family protein [Bifidobacterium sp. MA2]|uniref:Mechanosensitive ion channel family protein n=1 Tax=Bifidobacterium santillanense TaxID=2809028 RepID=A0ABS5URU3_9BIFI|nr:mechanosensitive ion channel family protein [Bifidobacterium santillanense]MBT1173479.1 mechanosensitive ion channel family protein [Bifidobacterium santillanense]
MDTVDVTSVDDLVRTWFRANAGKLLWLLIVLIVAWVADRVLRRVLRKVLDNSQIPSASIFINLMRVVVWCAAATMVLQPVFGINPTTLVTALGVGGVALSLGLKDTIANVIGGFGLMLGHVIQPGDPVTIQGVTGTVVDITWRHSMIETRAGDRMVIPNSILNTASLTKLTASNESMTTIPFTVKGGSDPDEVGRDMTTRVQHGAADVMRPENPPIVKFTGFSPYGMEGQILLFAREGVLLSTVKDRAARAIADADYLVRDGGASE